MSRAFGPAHPQHLDGVQGGGVRLRAGMLNVTIRPTLLVALAVAGAIIHRDVLVVLAWVVLGPAVLLLTQAPTAALVRAYGALATVELTFHGGLTRWSPSRELSNRAALATVLAAPASAAAVVGLTVITASSLGIYLVGTPAEDARLGQVLGMIVLVASAALFIDLIPAFPTAGGRALLTVIPGTPYARVTRVATIGTVASAVITVGFVTGGELALALVPAFFVMSNGWMVLRGDRAIGQRAPASIESGDWVSIRRRVAAGCETLEVAAAAQRRARAAGKFEEAAEIGVAALEVGWHYNGFAAQTAAAYAGLERADQALAYVVKAVELGASADELASWPEFSDIRHSPGWPGKPAVLDHSASAHGARRPVEDDPLAVIITLDPAPVPADHADA